MRFTLEDFIRESNRIEGIHRDPTNKEIEAHKKFLVQDIITIESLEEFVKAVQPNAVLRDKAGLNVYVGNHVPPPGGMQVVYQLRALLASIYAEPERPGAYEIHQEYETLHPFTDGNGRSGRVLWLWMRNGEAPLGFLHHWYYDSLSRWRI